MALADYDHDGKVALLVADDFDKSNFLYHNKGNMQFEEVALASQVGCRDGDGRTYAGMG